MKVEISHFLGDPKSAQNRTFVSQVVDSKGQTFEKAIFKRPISAGRLSQTIENKANCPRQKVSHDLQKGSSKLIFRRQNLQTIENKG
jgi:hypothetical protein